MTADTLNNVKKAYGPVEVIHGVDLGINDGEFVVFVGPSGCGKSTLLRMIAGLESITSGEMSIGGDVVNDIPPSQRGIAMVFQSYALYPHMTVFDNMAFSMRIAKAAKSEIEKRVDEAAEILQLTPYLDRLPKALSGGQRQRVAIGRAICRNPKVFLFDEPLSNLDAALRVATRIKIAKLKESLPDSTMIYVTHDQVEAMTLADRIVVLSAGYIEQVGAPIELYERPANLFVARFIGSPAMNVLPVTVTGTGEKTTVTVDGQPGSIELPIATKSQHQDTKASLGFRPQDVEVANGKGAQIGGEITLVESLGEVTNLYVEVPGAEEPVVAKVSGVQNYKQHAKIGINGVTSKMHLFDSEGRSMLLS